MNLGAWQRRFAVAIVTAAATLSLTTITQAAGDPGAASGKASHQSKLYIVQMSDAPVVSYDGGIAGYKATKPAQGKKIDPLATDVVRYAGYLTAKHDAALQKVGGARKAYSYNYAFNGFAAELSEAQAAALRATAGVVNVSKDEMRALDTSSTPAFLGLSDTGGLWDQVGGVNKAGENIIIGMVDSGAWPESLSFSDRTGTNGNASKDGKLSYQQIPGWHGKCTPGEAFTATNCNQKLIGARYYNAGWGGNAAIDTLFPFEFNSPRDWAGHGTHTSSTAGGNHGVAATGAASIFGAISGMAPRARIAAYKVCWADQPTGGGCFNSDSVAAIDQAVADGVDVINFSISGTLTNFLDPVEVAFLFAADAGVFVAASAGNDGPTTSTVAHPSPWLTTVAAGTHNRDGKGSVTLGNNATYFGASVANAIGPLPLIDSEAAGLPGADATKVRLCYAAVDNPVAGVPTPVLDPAKIAGKIVVCDRGVTGRVNKSLAVLQGGGAGMILLNTSPNSLNADFHFVPTVHLQNTDRGAVKAYAATPGPTATINQATIVYNAPAPFTASFSSRGPLRAGGGDLLKPDVIAPGQDILASVAPPNNAGRDFDMYSGTSMSSPHVAGLGALLKQAHPNWSPMMIKSALMTSAYDVLDAIAPTSTADAASLKTFRQGAGHVEPNSAVDPGLVFNNGFLDWLALLCGATNGVSPSTCAALQSLGYSVDLSDFNGASIAIGNLAGVQTVTRRVTNVGNGPANYASSVSGMTGIDVAVSPSSFTINPGETKTLTITFTRTSAALNAYTGGELTFSDGTHDVRIPLVVFPVALAAPAQVSGNGGPISYNVTFGYTGPFTATARGLIPATINADTVLDDPTNSTCSLTSPNAKKYDVVVPAGTTYLRFGLFDADVNPGSDIDLCLFDSGGNKVGSSTSGTAQEEINLVNPAADTYTIVVQGWGVNVSTPFKLHTWVLDATNVGNMTVSAPASATTGATAPINLTFSGLAGATKYLGSVAYGGSAGLPNPTIVRIDTP